MQNGSPAGLHDFASRGALLNLRGLTGTDLWFSMNVFDFTPTYGCGTPGSPITKTPINIDGLPGFLYTRRGVQDADLPVADAVVDRSGRCYSLQLVGGPAVATSDAGLTLVAIAMSFRFNA